MCDTDSWAGLMVLLQLLTGCVAVWRQAESPAHAEAGTTALYPTRLDYLTSNACCTAR